MHVVHAFRLQARACGELGSPMYEGLLNRLADELADGSRTPAAEVLQGHEDDPGPSALALRLVGGLHRLVLAGEVPSLAPYYPSVGGRWDLEAAWPVVTTTMTERHAELVAALDSPPQTNEVGRSTALLGGLLCITSRHPHPVRLFEIGASAGLNLRADHFRYLRADGTGWGPVDSPVVLDPAWQGAPLPTDAPLRIVERVGSDVAPVHIDTEHGRLTLLSYVWPDQAARIARLRGAFEIADRVPVDLRHCDAVEMLDSVELGDGTATVLWHSVMWQYLDAGQKAACAARIEELGSRATADRPFAHLTFEPQRRTPHTEREFLVVLRVWPGGERQVLGSAAPHGVPASWE